MLASQTRERDLIAINDQWPPPWPVFDFDFSSLDPSLAPGVWHPGFFSILLCCSNPYIPQLRPRAHPAKLRSVWGCTAASTDIPA